MKRKKQAPRSRRAAAHDGAPAASSNNWSVASLWGPSVVVRARRSLAATSRAVNLRTCCPSLDLRSDSYNNARTQSKFQASHRSRCEGGERSDRGGASSIERAFAFDGRRFAQRTARRRHPRARWAQDRPPARQGATLTRRLGAGPAMFEIICDHPPEYCSHRPGGSPGFLVEQW